MPHRSLRIFIIDDDTIYQYTTKKTIELLNFEGNISCFSNGEGAIEYMVKNCREKSLLPDIILLDLNMPVMNGWQFLESYKLAKHALSKLSSIYMVSSSLDAGDVSKSRANPDVEDFFIKPVVSDQLLKIIAETANKQTK